MDVRLLYHTPEPERAIAAAARLCYAPVGAAELLEHMTDDAVRRVLSGAIYLNDRIATRIISRLASNGVEPTATPADQGPEP